MRQLKQLSLLLGLLLLGPSAYAQSVRFQSQAISTRGAGIANATVAVCTQPANTNTQPCSPLATLATSTSTTSGGANPLTADSFGNFFFYAAPGRYTVQIYGPAVSGQFVTPDVEVTSTAGGSSGAFSTLTVSGAGTFTGAFKTNNLWAEIYPSGLAGATCGDKIAAAIALLPANGGRLNINQACGAGSGATPWTAVSSSLNNLSINFIEPGNYFHGGITLTGNNATITSPFPCARGPNNATPCAVTLTEGNSLNLASSITIGGAEDTISNVALDGNNTNNASGGVVVKINNANRARIDGVNIQHGATHGLWIFSTVGTDNSCCATVSNSQIQGNTNDGILCQNTTDLFVMPANEIETNGADGIELSDCGGVRIVGSEVSTSNSTGGNAAIEVYGTVAGGGSNNTQIVGDSFGNNSKHDVMITGFNTANTSLANTISGNRFVAGSSPGRGTNNTYDNIRLIDGGQNAITGNLLTSSAASHQNKYNIEITETAGSRAFRSTISGNESNGNNGSAGNMMGGNANDSTVQTSNFSSNYEAAASSQIGPNVYLTNNDTLQWKTAAGALDGVLRMDGSNNVVLTGDATTQRIFFQNNGVTVLGPLTGTGIGNSVGLQMFNTATTCTTAATINTPCTTAAITLPTAYADTNYRIGCSGLTRTNFPQIIDYAKSNTTFTITLNNLTAAAATYASFDCWAVHN